MTAQDVTKDDLVTVSENQVALSEKLDKLEALLSTQKKSQEEIALEEAKKPLTEEKLQKILSEKEQKEEEKRLLDRQYNEAAERAADKFNKIEESMKGLCTKLDIPFKEKIFNLVSTENIKIGNAEMKANNKPFDWAKFETRVKEDLLEAYNKSDSGDNVEKEIKTGSKSLTGLQDEVAINFGEGEKGDRVSELESILQGHIRAKSGHPKAGDRELTYMELTKYDREVNHARNQLRRRQYT